MRQELKGLGHLDQSHTFASPVSLHSSQLNAPSPRSHNRHEAKSFRFDADRSVGELTTGSNRQNGDVITVTTDRSGLAAQKPFFSNLREEKPDGMNGLQ
mmetsp:Transcript_18696/g.31964  ORF Transcript_18696/g.31964 Transcript_18696/m.31964 type:complete len:99 (+) Transcript_18696:619-915(+)